MSDSNEEWFPVECSKEYAERHDHKDTFLGYEQYSHKTQDGRHFYNVKIARKDSEGNWVSFDKLPVRSIEGGLK